MKNKKIALLIVAVLILAAGIGVGAYAASNYGTKDDPLVAKSYLDKTLTPRLQAEFEARLDSEVKKLEDEISGLDVANFKAISLKSGQSLAASSGCEIILRSGSAEVLGEGGLSDVTAGASLSAGQAISKDHLLMAATSGDGISATTDATVLIRGGYKIS
ncbi:MAG: hypothetical protein GX025_06585 [Clostridiales bacterium]|nr:hypothetical protein [Clostridiales bacterium]